MVNPYVSMFAPKSVYGRSIEINFPTRREKLRGDVTRSAAIGNFGKTGNDDLPIWDTCPDPCSEDTNKTHGGGNPELCIIYKSIVTGYPDILTNMPLFTT